MKVFLGGTCNGSTWREKLIQMIEIDYFNPVVDNWDETAYQNELRERETCDFVLYVITPKMTGAYSIAEAVDDSNKRPEKTIFCVLREDDSKKFTKSQIKSLMSVAKMIKKNGGTIFYSLDRVANYLNEESKKENKKKQTNCNHIWQESFLYRYCEVCGKEQDAKKLLKRMLRIFRRQWPKRLEKEVVKEMGSLGQPFEILNELENLLKS